MEETRKAGLCVIRNFKVARHLLDEVFLGAAEFICVLVNFGLMLLYPHYLCSKIHCHIKGAARFAVMLFYRNLA